MSKDIAIIVEVVESIKSGDLRERLIAYAVHLADADNKRREQAPKANAPASPRQKIDRLLDQIEPGETLDGIYWHTNKQLSV